MARVASYFQVWYDHQKQMARKAARYDWLASGGIYRIGFDSTGGVSLEQWDSVIDEQMDTENER